MISINIKIDDGIKPVLKGMKRELKKYPRDAHAEYVRLTPIGKPSTWKSGKAPSGYVPGNARRSTNLSSSDVIEADYDYAQRLDRGWSRQRPNGMTAPFMRWVRKKVKMIFGK